MHRYVFIEPESHIDHDDVVVADELSLSEAAELIRKRGSPGVLWNEFDHGQFRCFEMTLLKTVMGFSTRSVLAATVPATKDIGADRACAMRMINVQTVDRQGELCSGKILTQAEFAARLAHVAERREARRLDREITTSIVQKLLNEGYSISCCMRDDEPELVKSRDQEKILELLFDLEIAELELRKKSRRPSWIVFSFGEDGWDCVADHSTDLAHIIDPIVEPHLPWVKDPQGPNQGYRVFVLPSPNELASGDTNAERAFDDFVDGMHSIFGD